MESMMRKTIKLVTPQDVKNFCFAASELPRNVSAMVSHGKAVVDAKSILGMFSLDLNEPVTLTAYATDSGVGLKKIEIYTQWVYNNRCKEVRETDKEDIQWLLNILIPIIYQEAKEM